MFKLGISLFVFLLSSDVIAGARIISFGDYDEDEQNNQNNLPQNTKVDPDLISKKTGLDSTCYCVHESQCTISTNVNTDGNLFLDIIIRKSISSCELSSQICCQSSDITCSCTESATCADSFPNSAGICTRSQICCTNVVEKQTSSSLISTPAPGKSSGICGWSGSKIIEKTVNGKGASIGEFPWFVAVVGKDENVLFSGSLIHPQVVLTVAHRAQSFGPEELFVRAGNPSLKSTTQIKAVGDIYIDSHFNSANLNNNVALLMLVRNTMFELNDHVKTMCLPMRKPQFIKEQCITGGWGSDKSKSAAPTYVKLPIVDRNNCQTSLQNYRLGIFFKLHKSFICAGGPKGDTCESDGGSPLFCPMEIKANSLDIKYVQVGITAWGVGCGIEGVPGVYSSVESSLRWISRTVGQVFGRPAYPYFTP